MSRSDESVLILKPSSFGDIIHTLPAVAWLKSRWQGSRFTWLVNTEWLPLLEGNPGLESIVEFPRSKFRGWSGAAKFYHWQKRFIANTQPDAALDFQGLLRSAVIGRLSAPRKFYGMSDAREGARWFYNRIAPMPVGIPHAVERYLALARFVLEDRGWLDNEHEIVPKHFPLPAGEALDAPAAGKLYDDFILLHPSARGQGKSLSVESIDKFCTCIAPRQVVLVGRRTQEGELAPAGTLDLRDQTSLRQLIWVMRRAAFVISVDSGPAHLAAALDRPMAAIHTWSDPRRVGPYRPDAWVWKSGRMMQMQKLATIEDSVFSAPPSPLTDSHIEEICALAISPSNSSA